MKTSKYQALDVAIVDRIGNAPMHFHLIFVGAVRAECERLAREDGRDAFRVLDGRLQALRRAGKLQFCGSGKGMGWKRVGAPREQSHQGE